MSKKYRVQERTFLNLKTEMRAYIIGVIEDTREVPNVNDLYVSKMRDELRSSPGFDYRNFSAAAQFAANNKEQHYGP